MTLGALGRNGGSGGRGKGKPTLYFYFSFKKKQVKKIGVSGKFLLEGRFLLGGLKYTPWIYEKLHCSAVSEIIQFNR